MTDEKELSVSAKEPKKILLKEYKYPDWMSIEASLIGFWDDYQTDKENPLWDELSLTFDFLGNYNGFHTYIVYQK